jgi:ectoine hydroxylase-related dioxygenase (phytanoyl-CoA dioxygenase family)
MTDDEVVAAIDDAGFAIVPRPRPAFDLGVAYDAAVAAAADGDVHHGRSCMRVNDFVNRGPEFDAFWRDPLLLAVCERLFTRPFKLGTLHARTVRAGGEAQELHVDCARDDGGLTLLGFLWMIDGFRSDNGATRFVPRGQSGEVLAIGAPGSLVVYDGSVRHGYSRNRSREPRRSLQGSFILRTLAQGVDMRSRLLPATAARLDARARYLLDVEG